MDEKKLLIKTCNRIVRKTQAHLDIVLKDYHLSSGSYPYLLELRDNEGINSEKLSKKLNVDKAMSTRTIRKLIQLGYLTKVPDELDSRAFRLYLTDEARECIPGIVKKISQWIDYITEDLNEEENRLVTHLLIKIADKTESKGM